MLRLATLALALSACSISPVVTDPDLGGGGRYDECRRASRDYCRHVVRAGDDELDECLAQYTYTCTAGLEN